VDVRAVADLPKPVPLDLIKQMGKLKTMVLVKNSRLSVQPVTLAEWREVCRMGGLDPEKLAR
jgi:predicted RNA-binding protein with PUA-like domain